MGEIIDIAGLLSLRTALDAADFFEAPTSAERQALEEWNERLDVTSPWTSDLAVLSDLVTTAPADVDSYTLGLLQGVLDTRSGATAAATAEDEDKEYGRGYRQGVASVRPMASA